MARIYCPQCQPMAINGTPCHESGCPCERQKWEFRSIGRDPDDRRKHLNVCIPKKEETPQYMLEK